MVRTGRAPETAALRRHAAMLTAALLEKEAVLKYLLLHAQEQKREIAHAFLDGIEQLVLPTLLRLRGELRGGQGRVLDAAIGHLRDLGAPLVERLGSDFAKLNPAEVRVCSLVRQGLSAKEIAAVEGVAASAVRTHRRNIRRKLGLGGSRDTLASFLAPRRTRRRGVCRNTARNTRRAGAGSRPTRPVGPPDPSPSFACFRGAEKDRRRRRTAMFRKHSPPPARRGRMNHYQLYFREGGRWEWLCTIEAANHVIAFHLTLVFLGERHRHKPIRLDQDLEGVYRKPCPVPRDPR